MTPRGNLAVCIVGIVLFHGCATTAYVKAPEPGPIQGIASWYGEEFAGRVTASGEIFDPLELTAAHPALPFGTIAEVTNLSSGATVEVRINDRGPYIGKRIIDLSYAAAQKIGLVEPGIGMVELKIVHLGDGRRVRPPDPELLDEGPPKVAFPMPYEVRTPSAAAAHEDSDFEVEVVEERSGVPTRRKVSADGRDIESVPIDGQSVLPPQIVVATPEKLPERYFLQLGAFQNEDNAEALRRKGAAIITPVFIEESMGFFRVRMGPFPSRERALQVQEKLRSAGLPSLLLSE